MKNQSGAIKTNLELYRVVMGGSGGYRRLTGGSDDFSLQTNTQTLHHNIYIIIIIIIIITIIIIIVIMAWLYWSPAQRVRCLHPVREVSPGSSAT